MSQIGVLVVMFDKIVLQSAGSLAVAILGLLMVVLQVVFFLKKPSFKWFVWSAAISFSGMVYAIGIFLEYNTPAGNLNRFGGLLEFSALLGLVHCLFGFTFSYFGLKGRRYHTLAGFFHILILILLWTSSHIVADVFVRRDFIWSSQPYIESDVGPLGLLFELYVALSCITAIVFWIRYKGPDPGYRYTYVAGMLCWLAFGLHDALASLGASSVLYFMEYGYFSFSAVVLWVLFSSYVDASVEDKYRVITEFASDGILFLQGGKTVFGNPAANDLLGRPVNRAKVEKLIKAIIPEDRESLLQYCRDLNWTRESAGAVAIRVKAEDRKEQIVEIRASLIQYRDRPAKLIIMRDITEKVKEEQDLKENEQKMFRLKKMESLGLLAGGVAHDLNNVLSGIINYPELILMNLPEDSSLRKSVEAIKQSGLKAVAIVQDLLTMARGVAIVKQPLNLNDEVLNYLSSPEHHKLKHYHPDVTINTDLDTNLFNIRGIVGSYREGGHEPGVQCQRSHRGAGRDHRPYRKQVSRPAVERL